MGTNTKTTLSPEQRLTAMRERRLHMLAWVADAHGGVPFEPQLVATLLRVPVATVHKWTSEGLITFKKKA
jgi:hypothetical protein